MGRKANIKYFVGDFETTVFEGQIYTEVWSSAVVELYSEDVKIFHSIEDTFKYLCGLNSNVVIYYHNLKFDGHFWLDLFLRKMGLKQAIQDPTIDQTTWLNDSDMPSRSFKYLISDFGQWYFIKVKWGSHIIEIRDSLKLLPFSVKAIGESFQTKHKKLEMDYSGFRYAGCEIKPEEIEYIKNDVLVVKEALEIMFDEGHKKITIGACCFSEYQNILTRQVFNKIHPNLYEIPIDPDLYGASNAGEYIRKSYRGGWCYLVRGKEQKMFKNGITLDVNSLYPSMMESASSHNKYPIGQPHFWTGDIPDEAQEDNKYYFVKLRTRFYLKPGKLPFIQIKHNFAYMANECLETSDIKGKDGKYYKFYRDFDGKIKPSVVELTLTKTDYILFREHYNLEDTVILSGCWFDAVGGMFDEYINKYKLIKQTSTGARKGIAKLFLNNLYGRLSASTNSSFKVAYLNENGIICFRTVMEHDKLPGYIAIGSAITSYARNFTIRAAQANYYGPDNPGFIYADTDSLHCDLSEDQVKGVKIHDSDFCCWKIENKWERGWFVRQKTYIEVNEDHFDIKCAGLPDRCKQQFVAAVENGDNVIEDFNIGYEIEGKLKPTRILGGVILEETNYRMR